MGSRTLEIISENAQKIDAFFKLPTYRTRRNIQCHYTTLNPTDIFGMIGRCGGGYNTIWEDWSEQGRLDRQRIMEEFEVEMNKLTGHYEKLEASILTEGFINPLIVTCGYPLIRNIKNLPPEWKNKNIEDLLLLEGGTGGSRLWVAQKYNIPVPCIINDTTKRFSYLPTIYSTESAREHYKTPPELQLSVRFGIREVVDTATHTHLEPKYRSDKAIIEQRAIMYYNLMKKHGRPIQLPSNLQYLLSKLND